MMKQRAFYKRVDELVAWDLDAGCRHIVDQTAPSKRKLKKRLRRQARRRVNAVAMDEAQE